MKNINLTHYKDNNTYERLVYPEDINKVHDKLDSAKYLLRYADTTSKLAEVNNMIRKALDAGIELRKKAYRRHKRLGND